MLETEREQRRDARGPHLQESLAKIEPGPHDPLGVAGLDGAPETAAHVGLRLVEDLARQSHTEQPGAIAVDRARHAAAPEAHGLRGTPDATGPALARRTPGGRAGRRQAKTQARRAGPEPAPGWHDS